MASKLPLKSLPVRGRAPGALEGVESKSWQRSERVAQALRSLGDTPMTHARAKRLGQRFGVHQATIYRYRSRLAGIDETTAIAGRTRGWKPLASRLSAKQEQAIEEAVNAMRKKPGPLRVVDLVEEVAARCRLLRAPCPSRPAIDRRLKRLSGLKLHRRGVAPPGNADPKISPGSFIVRRPLDVVQIDHTPMDIVVGDDLYRQPLGKPYLTLATDVTTRCILAVR
jgi:putative transposase